MPTQNARSTRHRLPLAAATALLVACGGAQSTTTTTGGDGTTGGETAEAPHPIRTTTPIPVPQPAIAREQMSPELQQLWDRVEEAVAVRPPEPPADASLETVEAWAAGPFADWLGHRAEAASAVQEALTPLEGHPAHERGVAAGLYAYLQEDMVADVRGAPIPDSIAADPELLRTYDHAMLEALAPYARTALTAYRFCDAAFTEGDAPEWEEWATYCRDRADDIEQVYGMTHAPGAAEPAEPADAGGADDAGASSSEE